MRPYDLAEAYIRDGREDEAEQLLLTYAPDPGTEPWPYAAAARCRAMLADNDNVEPAFRNALDARACATMPFERARTLLYFGERLRRARHRSQARLHLHEALEIFERLGATLWPQRANAELRATGKPGTGRRHSIDRLTPQELQVALLVGRGASLSLAVIARQFAVESRQLADKKPHLAKHAGVQWACVIVILAAVAWVAAGHWLDLTVGKITPLYAGEVASVWAFGVSWLLASRSYVNGFATPELP